jgi:bifunctional UDP-N-acetylglucosamine pyrophosphorylase/glucosamine-1-phosphate N-acetyltransferase
MESRVSQAPRRTVVVLAAGEGKRMKSATPKVLHPLLGRTLVGHVLVAAGAAHAEQHDRGGRAQGRAGRGAPGRGRAGRHAGAAGQQNGTGHAVRHRARGRAGRAGTVVVLNGDVPLLRPETVAALIDAHESAARRDRAGRRGGRPDRAGPDRAGRGGNLERIVEERDASPRSGRSARSTPASTRSTRRCCGRRWASCPPTTTRARNNLTDVFGILASWGTPVGVFVGAGRRRDAGLQRPGRAGEPCGRCCATG